MVIVPCALEYHTESLICSQLGSRSPFSALSSQVWKKAEDNVAETTVRSRPTWRIFSSRLL
jgi:hypothetical protein